MRAFSAIDMQPPTWTRGQPVTIRFQTAQRFLQGQLVGESLTMTIYLFSVKLVPEVSEFPIHKYEGVITERSIAPRNAYEVTFVPPKWLPDGEYLLSFNFGNQRQSYVHFAVQIGAKLTGDVRGESILDHPPVQALKSTLENFKLSSEFDRDTWKDKLTEKLESSGLSLQDVCHLCSGDEQSKEICVNYIQEMWEVGQRLAKEDPKLELVSTPTTVKEICRYARLDSEIQQLFFKYRSQSDVMTASRWALAKRPPHTDITIPWFNPFMNLKERLSSYLQ